MKVIAFNGSPRKEGNTFRLLRTVLGELTKAGIETELVQLAGKTIRGCIGCRKCIANQNRRCSVTQDDLNACLEKMHEADGLLLGSPTYFADVTPEIKALMDRSAFVSRANGDTFKRKVGAAVIAVRRAGGIHAFDTLNHFFTISQMIIPGSSYWNLGIGRDPGDVEKDEEGMKTMEVLGQNMAWLLQKLAG